MFSFLYYITTKQKPQSLCIGIAVYIWRRERFELILAPLALSASCAEQVEKVNVQQQLAPRVSLAPSRKKHTPMGVCFFGGEREIRTLGRVLAYTRFPVVRLRPTQPSLRATHTLYHTLF